MTDTNKNRETLEKHIEFIVTHLKMELDRLSDFSLGQLKINEMSSEIKLIVEEYLNKILYLIDIEGESNINLKNFFFKMMRNYKLKIETNDKKISMLQKISELNLLHDFHQIIENLKEFDLPDTDKLLAYLVMLNVKKRFERLYILFCPFSRSCVLPQKKSICNFPNYKICPEYQLKERKLKSKLKKIH